MELKGEVRGKVAILSISGGAYTNQDADKIDKAFAGLRNAKRHRLVINMADLEYVNSLTIGHIVSFAGEARQAGGRVVLACPRPTVMTMMRALGLTSMVLAFNTIEEAIEVVEGGGPIKGKTVILR